MSLWKHAWGIQLNMEFIIVRAVKCVNHLDQIILTMHDPPSGGKQQQQQRTLLTCSENLNV